MLYLWGLHTALTEQFLHSQLLQTHNRADLTLNVACQVGK